MVGHRSTCRMGRSTSPGFSTARPNAIIHVERVDSVSLRWLKKPFVTDPSGSRPNSGRMNIVRP